MKKKINLSLWNLHEEKECFKNDGSVVCLCKVCREKGMELLNSVSDLDIKYFEYQNFYYIGYVVAESDTIVKAWRVL